jgi:hypothetical protein
MSLFALASALDDDVYRPAAVECFRSARLRQVALIDHPDPASLHQALAGAEPEIRSERLALVRALIGEYQQTGNSLWAGLLLVAFVPMLTRLRGKFRDPGFSAQDLDQIVVTAFLEVAVRIVPADRWLLMNLHRRTAAAVLQVVQREREQRANCFDAAVNFCADEAAPPAVPSPEAMDAAIEAIGNREADRRTAAMLREALLGNATVADLLPVLYPGAPVEAYAHLEQREKRRRHRALRRLREAVQRDAAERLGPQGALLALHLDAA